MAVVSGGVVGLGDTAVHGATSIAVEAAGLTLGGVSEASGAGAVVLLATTLLGIPNLPPPFPFDEASEKWDGLGSSLREVRKDVGNLLNGKGGVDAEWKGPAADAFRDYVNKTLLPAMDKLAECADAAKVTCSAISSSLDQGLIIYFATCAVGIALCIAENYLDAIPIVGAFLCAAAKWIVVDAWGIAILYNLYDMYNTLESFKGDQAKLETAYKDLAKVFSTDGSKFDAGAIETARKKIESTVSNKGDWHKQ